MHKKHDLSIEEKERQQEIWKEWCKKIRLTFCLGASLLTAGIILSIISPETPDGTENSLFSLALVFTAIGSGLLALCIYRWHEIPLELTEEALKKREILFSILSSIFIILLAITPFLYQMLLKQVLRIVSTSGLGVSINLVICTFDSRMAIEEKRIIDEIRQLK